MDDPKKGWHPLGKLPHRWWWLGGAFLVMTAWVALTAQRLYPSAPYEPNPPAAIDRFVAAEMEELDIPGLGLGIVQNDRVVHQRGFGAADPAGRPVTPETPFFTGSVTKSFTALAIMQLVEEGRVDLDAPVQTYLPWFGVADPEASSLITVRHLLHQTSGLSTLTGNATIDVVDLSDQALEREVRRLAGYSLSQPVGSGYQYSNSNFATLGLIVQTVSGQSYESYLADHVFAPLAMNETSAVPEQAHDFGLATGHQFRFGRPRPTPAEPPYTLLANRGIAPAGWVTSSVDDMTHYLIAQLNGGRYAETSVLSPEGIAELHRPVADMDKEGFGYGMGWAAGEVDGMDVVVHSGGGVDFHTMMVLAPTPRRGVVVLMNADSGFEGGRYDAIAYGVMSLLEGRAPAPAPPAQMTGLFLALGVLAVELILIAVLLRALRRWRARPGLRPHGSWRWALWVGLPCLLGLLLGWWLLIVVPTSIGQPTSVLPHTDDGLALLVSGGLAVIWAVVWPALVVFGTRGASTDAAPSDQAPELAPVSRAM